MTLETGNSTHFELLRNQLRSLTEKHTELQRKFDESHANSAHADGLGCRLAKFAKKLYGQEIFSDIVIKLESGIEVKAHRFIIAARSDFWDDLATRNELEFDAVSREVFDVFLNWLYTDRIDPNIGDELLIGCAEFAAKYKFEGLVGVCVLWLSSRLDVATCVQCFEFAERYNIASLRENCAALVAARWSEFNKSHFAHLSAPLLYRLLKGHASDVLISVIELEREDVLFLYFIEFDKQLPTRLNAPSAVLSPLEASLRLASFDIAEQLIHHGASVNLIYSSGDKSSILVRMIRQGRSAACNFLVSRGADVNTVQDELQFSTPLQVACACDLKEDMIGFISTNVEKFDINLVPTIQDPKNRRQSAVIISVLNKYFCSLRLLEMVMKANADPNILDKDGKSALYYALCVEKNLDKAKLLIAHGADVNFKLESDPLIHLLVEDVVAFEFLIENGADVLLKNGECQPLLHRLLSLLPFPGDVHVVCRQLRVLLKKGVDINASDGNGDNALHVAVATCVEAVECIVAGATNIEWSSIDSKGRTALDLALEEKRFDAASVLIRGGAPLQSGGRSLLISAIDRLDDDGAVFLLEHKADYRVKDAAGRSALELAVTKGLAKTVRMLCESGINLNERTDGGNGFTVLEKALSGGHLKCAELLVSYGCDVESWTVLPDLKNTEDECEQTLLHYLLDERNQEAAVFLIESGSDVNATKRYTKQSSDDLQTPLHIAVAWGMTDVVKCLMAKGASLIAQDINGRTAAHIAISDGNHEALAEILKSTDLTFIGVRDKLGQTPLSAAIMKRDHKSAADIVRVQPHAALQVNGNGENLLHVAVRTNDLESVLFLLGTHTDPTRTTQDSVRKTALHLAACVDNELIMRNLILAGCVVDARSSDGATPLHDAARAKRANLVSILLENGAQSSIVDERGETALLTAVRSGSISCIKAMVTHGGVDVTAFNKVGQTALHLVAQLQADKLEKGSSSTEMCELLLNASGSQLRGAEKEFTAFVDAKDASGNTALLLAYIGGNGGVCRSLLKRGATMGAQNSEGVTVFTHETPTKQLLYALLESLEREPRWSDGDACDCGARFSITQRKHHCRHCGRIVCAACSMTTMPIAKFGEEKKVRVCSMCTQVLTQGAARM